MMLFAVRLYFDEVELIRPVSCRRALVTRPRDGLRRVTSPDRCQSRSSV